jgi:membrane-associated phospholipid phosphatase
VVHRTRPAPLALVIIRLAPRTRVPVLVTATLLILAIGMSPIYLGVHWPLDVSPVTPLPSR